MRINITKDFGIIKVSGKYPEDIEKAYNILAQFKMIRPGSVWGLDGVAEYCASKHGVFTLNKSGISKRLAKQWIKLGKAELID